METKTCYRCGETKSVSDFYGRHLRCKECIKEIGREIYRSGTHPTKSYDGVFKASIKKLYGMTMEEYEALLRKQAYRCAICRGPEIRKRRNGQPMRLSVDHDHVTKIPRGLLCVRCNVIVWALEENHTLIPAIFAYVEKFRDELAKAGYMPPREVNPSPSQRKGYQRPAKSRKATP